MSTKKQKHAVLSPSSSKMWMKCDSYISFLADKSLKKEKYHEVENTMRDRGTMLHSIMHVLALHLYHLDGINSEQPTSEDEQMCAAALNRIQQEFGDFSTMEHILIEETLIHNNLYFGTPDLVLVSDDIIYIIDYKFGQTPLANLDFAQLRCYASLLFRDSRYNHIDVIEKDFKLVYAKPFQARGEFNCQFKSESFACTSMFLMGLYIDSRIRLYKSNTSGGKQKISKSCINCKYRDICLLTPENMDRLDGCIETLDSKELHEVFILDQVFKRCKDSYTQYLKKLEAGNGGEELDVVKSENLCVFSERNLPRAWDKQAFDNYLQALKPEESELYYTDKPMSFDEACEKYGKEFIEPFFDKKVSHSVIESK